jgi:hypothetical protein
MYSTETGRFLTRDVWQGDYNRPLSLNKWNYVEGNPINRTDPSGMMSCLNHDYDTECSSYATQIKQYAEAIKTGVTWGGIEPVEGFAETVDFAYWIFNNDYRGMLWALTNIINGMNPQQGPVWIQVKINNTQNNKYYIGQDWLPYRNDPSANDANWGGGEKGIWIHSLRGDWAKKYWDKTANQAYHFWFYVATSFFDGQAIAETGNAVHDGKSDWEDYDYSQTGVNIYNPLSRINRPVEKVPPPKSGISEPDYMLGIKGIEFGARMKHEYLENNEYFRDCFNQRPVLPLSFKPGDWIRNNLKQ